MEFDVEEIYIVSAILNILLLILLYLTRYDSEKVLKRWTILLFIVMWGIPYINLSFSIVAYIVYFMFLLIDEDCTFAFGISDKFKNWFNKDI